MRWWILKNIGTDFVEVPVEKLGPRPDDAMPENGDPYTPWHDATEHLHFSKQSGTMAISSAHVRAETLEEAKQHAQQLVEELVDRANELLAEKRRVSRTNKRKS